MTPEERAGIEMAAKIGMTIEFRSDHFTTWFAANELRIGMHYYRIKPRDEQA